MEILGLQEVFARKRQVSHSLHSLFKIWLCSMLRMSSPSDDAWKAKTSDTRRYDKRLTRNLKSPGNLLSLRQLQDKIEKRKWPILFGSSDVDITQLLNALKSSNSSNQGNSVDSEIAQFIKYLENTTQYGSQGSLSVSGSQSLFSIYAWWIQKKDKDVLALIYGWPLFFRFRGLISIANAFPENIAKMLYRGLNSGDFNF